MLPDNYHNIDPIEVVHDAGSAMPEPLPSMNLREDQPQVGRWGEEWVDGWPLMEALIALCCQSFGMGSSHSREMWVWVINPLIQISG